MLCRVMVLPELASPWARSWAPAEAEAPLDLEAAASTEAVVRPVAQVHSEDHDAVVAATMSAWQVEAGNVVAEDDAGENWGVQRTASGSPCAFACAAAAAVAAAVDGNTGVRVAY